MAVVKYTHGWILYFIPLGYMSVSMIHAFITMAAYYRLESGKAISPGLFLVLMVTIGFGYLESSVVAYDL